VETLVQEQQQREALERLNQEVSAYYDSLTAEEIAEQQEWGEFAGGALLETLKEEEEEQK